MIASVLLGAILVAGVAQPPTAHAATFQNLNPILIPAGQPGSTLGDATAYPSTITVSGLYSCITGVTVTLSGFSHARVDDIDLALVGPTGQAVMLMGRAGGATNVSGITVTFDDAGAVMPAALVAGTFKPTDLNVGGLGFNPPGPAVRPTSVTLASFVGTDPNGIWNLYAVDRASGNVGQITSWSLNITTAPAVIAPSAPASCITPTTPCVDVPVTIVLPCAPGPLGPKIHGYQITVTLPASLALCTPSGIVEGSYLNSLGGGSSTYFNVTPGAPGVYTVDCLVFPGGPPTCGSSAVTGTLFTIKLKTVALGSGSGTVNVATNHLYDCDGNDLIPVAPTSTTVNYTTATPSITGLTAAYTPTGNGAVPNGMTRINVSWTATGLPGGVNLYRVDFGPGSYPTYGGAAPSTPVSCPPAGLWTLVSGGDGDGVHADNFPLVGDHRGFWYYVACATSVCGPVLSSMTPGTLNYHLGDVTNGVTPGTGDHLVNLPDLSLLLAHLGAVKTTPPGFPPYIDYLDIGNPAVTGPGLTKKRPVPDNLINFFDLAVLSLNYNLVSEPQLIAKSGNEVAIDENLLWVDSPTSVNAGDLFTVALKIRGSGVIQALQSQLTWNGAVAEPVAGSLVAGDIINNQIGTVASVHPGDIEAFLFGERSSGNGMLGEGVVATMTFRATASGNPSVDLGGASAFDYEMLPITLKVTSLGIGDPSPQTVAFAVKPNPFQKEASLTFSLPQKGRVELVIYSVDGRRVKTLVNETLAAGMHAATWNGTDENGAMVKPGVFFARLVGPNMAQKRSVTFMR